MDPIYLDHNASAPLRPEALRALSDAALHTFGNASSAHAFGAAARAALSRARRRVAELAGVAPEALVFTSGATESNNTVLRQVESGAHVVSAATEHPSVLEELAALRARGVRVSVLPVDRDGRLDPGRFAAALAPETALASVAVANHETGVLQPLAELARAAAARGVRFHTDAAQALGKVALDLGRLPVDYASFSAHKLGGPKGVGALYVRAGAPLAALLRGGAQERGRRAGTENLPGIAAFGAACEAARLELDACAARLGELRDFLWAGVARAIPDAVRNGGPQHALAHVLDVSFPGASGETLVEALDLEGIAVSTGAACHSGSTEPSPVLLAMGVPEELARAALRFSLGPANTRAELERVLECLPALVARVRRARAA
ncbi:MAG TPA: cysteine desulfurase family protein [Myxococcota bacterium]|nr:cysteine desulfurase family protein [Myxococcota bacterium]